MSDFTVRVAEAVVFAFAAMFHSRLQCRKKATCRGVKDGRGGRVRVEGEGEITQNAAEGDESPKMKS